MDGYSGPMSEPNSTPPAQSTPPVPPAPTYTYGQPAPAQPAPVQPAQVQPAPPAAPPRPQYGEYAPPGYVPPVPPQPQPGFPAYAASVPAPGGRRRRTWDVVLTIVFLVLGLFGTALGLMYAAILSTPGLLDEALRAQGYGGFSGEVGAGATIIAVSHIALYLVAVVLSIVLLVKRFIAFWVPLAAGVIAAIIFWATLMGVLLSDPNLVPTNF